MASPRASNRLPVIHLISTCAVTPTVPSLTFSSGVTVEGMRTVAVYIASVCQDLQEYGPLLGESSLQRAEIDQWLEYRQTDVEKALRDKNLTKPVLQDFNCHLANKIYLVGNKLSLADVILYYALHGIIKHMMPQEKEMYTNISRWFNQVQSILAARQGLSLITFQRNQLYS
ncbi:eukaryotic translation elongation factor 1 epsilon-1-like isoform X2 [Actinia tenebrosa]|uniref:Eukaryotic translation elongation factor 1 epsilon-1-like isoform X2 n=1 Tax=Actinia tenebrosa TaxID=6105 RepID=A0A6P8HKS8_ACTTE|nr:eukaryotic translation elongation factor 1 epsilon-1-like isoform X2 [Actinia tenebrosa]